MTDTFRCGHERSETNSYLPQSGGSPRCRTCRAEKQKTRAREPDTRRRDYTTRRKRRLAESIRLTRAKLEGLLREAKRYGMDPST